jgi:hypothetical protein
MLTVVCVHWGHRYDPLYVYRLEAQVKANLGYGHRFCVLTDDRTRFPDLDCLETPRPAERGWWQKVLLFHPEVQSELCQGPAGLSKALDDRVLYLDLDSVITGPLEPVVATVPPPNGLVMVAPIKNVEKPFRNSSAILWRPGECGDIYQAYPGWQAAQAAWPGGDQRFISSLLMVGGNNARLQTFDRPLFASYKQHIRGRGAGGMDIPSVAGASVVMFHGKPKLHDLDPSNPWRQRWESSYRVSP